MQSGTNLRHLHSDVMDLALKIKLYNRENLQGLWTTVNVIHLNENYKFHGLWVDSTYVASYVQDETYMVFGTELCAVIESFKFFDLKNMKLLCSSHGIEPRQMSKSALCVLMTKHRCHTRCLSYVYVFRCLSNRRLRVLDKFAVSDASPGVSADFHALERDQAVQPTPITHTSTGFNVSSAIYNAVDIVESETEHLNLIGDEQKLAIIREWQKEMSTDRLALVVCAVCSIRTPKSGSEWVHARDVDLDLLRNDHLPVSLLPTTYNLEVYRHALLNVNGLETKDRLGHMRVCCRCLKSLSASAMPKFALSNWLYYGRDRLPEDVQKAFRESSVFERMLIARARSNSITCRFNTRGVKDTSRDAPKECDGSSSRGNALGQARRGIRGNIMVTPLDTLRMNSVIPPPANVIRDTMTTVFVGKGIPTRSTIKQYSPVLVRRSRVKTMIHFLLGANAYYRESDNFKYSQSNMNSLADGHEAEDNIPSAVYIGHLAENDALDTSTSDYTSRNVISGQEERDCGELLMENVGYTEGDYSPIAYQQMKNAALARCLSGKPYLGSGTGSDIIPDFKNPAILTWLFPHLDPWGIGGFHHPGRRRAISMEEQLRHLLLIDDGLFESDPEFAFVFYNVCRKSLVSHTLRFTVPARTHVRIVGDLLKLDPALLVQLNASCEKDPYYRPVDDKEKDAFKCLSAVRMVSKHVPGSDGYKTMLRNEIRGLMNHRGAPTLFITLNPSDVDNPIVRMLAGDDIDMEDVTRGEDLSKWRRSLFAAKNPSACSRFFDLMVTNFIKIILRYGRDEPGLYGRCTSYYGTVEAQGKGTLHCHMLIWLKGHLPPGRLIEQVGSSDEYREKFLAWLESVIQCQFPDSSGVDSQRMFHSRRVLHHENGDPHPGVIAPPLVDNYRTTGEFWKDYAQYVETLIHHYQWHEHTATCWKYLERGQEKSDQNCRVGMNGDTHEVSELDAESSEIILRRHHPKIAAHTDTTLFLMRCNMDIKYVGTGDAANAFVYYVTDYITKATLLVHVGMAALLYVLTRLLATPSDANKQGTGHAPAVRAVTMAVNSMMGRQEISHPQVMSYLVGGGDCYRSDKFALLQWGSIRLSCPLVRCDVSAESEDNESSAQESVTLLLEPYTMSISSQQFDYALRSAEAPFDTLCLYDFVAVTAKVWFPEAGTNGGPRSGSFADDRHPQYLTHHLVRCREYRIPVLLGPRIPNPSRSAVSKEEWSRDMLLLFKPWRDITNLKLANQTWSEAYDDFDPFVSEAHRNIMTNMLVSTECAEARDRHRERRRGKRTDDAIVDESMDALLRDFGDAVRGSDSEDERVYNPFEDLDAVGASENERRREVRSIVDDETYHLLDACFPDVVSDIGQGSVVSADKVCENDAISLGVQSEFMTKKRKRKVLGVDDRERSTDRSVRSRIEPLSQWMSLTADRTESLRMQGYAVMDDVICTMGLKDNQEQLRAFKIISTHIIDGKVDQLLMHVSGVGGTGKSHLIKSVVLLFNRLGIRKQLLLGAPTGIAAVLINGQTLHSLISASPSRKSVDMTALINTWRAARLLIIDEVSMMGSKFTSEFSSSVRLGRGDHIVDREKPFGGLNVVFMGDFGQLKPPKQAALYSNNLVKHPSFPEARNNDGISALNGAFIWRQVNTVVELVKNQRHAADPEYAAFLSRLRLRQCFNAPQDGRPYSDLDYLCTRLMANVSMTDPASLPGFVDAPIIVGSKALRDVLNAKLVKFHANRLGSELATYFSRDMVDKVLVEGSVQKRLWNIPSSENNEAFGILPLFIGMKVMVTENLAFDNGIVNGSEGVVTRIKYEEDNSGRRYPKVVYVKIPGCGICLSDDLGQDVAPIFPVATRLQHKLRNTKSRSFTRKQIPLVPAYVFTDFKAQGRTTDRVMVDIATARGQGAYVMLSRVKSLSGLLILRWFPPSKIYQRLPEELRDELDRLHTLSKATEANLSYE